MTGKQGTMEWRQGWTVVLTSMAGNAVAGIHLHSLGVFVGPIASELGWSHAQILSGLLAYSLSTIILIPLVGAMIDRFGVVPVGAPGMVLYCAAVSLLAFAARSHWLWWAFWLLIGAGGAFIKPTLWSSAVSRWFDSQRGLALSIMLCGSGLCATTIPFVANLLITRFGWREAYPMIAVSAAVVVVPLMFVFLRSPGRTPAASDALILPNIHGLGVWEAISSTQFLRIAFAALTMAFAMIGLSVNFIPITTSLGLDRGSAVAIVGLIGLTSVIGRVVTGVLLDRWNGPLIGALSFSLPVLAVMVLLSAHITRSSALIAAVTLGFSLGAENSILAYLATRYFGLKNYGVIFGVVVCLLVLGEGFGPTVAGFVYDIASSYALFLWICAAAFIVAAALVVSLGAYPDLKQRTLLAPQTD